MPELPEVETVCRGLNQFTLRQTIAGGEVLLPRTLAYPFSLETFWQGVQGTTILHWQRRGKYLLAMLASDTSQNAGWLGVHLRMTGQLLWVRREVPIAKHTRIRLFMGQDRELRFVDMRTFGKFWWIPPTQTPESIISGLKTMGPEPFSEAFSPQYLEQQLKKSNRNIKTVLLDQRVIAGIGNIYADEALFKAGILPNTPAMAITSKQVERLHGAIIEVLKTAIAQGGTTFSDFMGVTGINGNYGSLAWVYGRTGEACRVCGTSIKRIKLGGRSSHFCPGCQLG